MGLTSGVGVRCHFHHSGWVDHDARAKAIAVKIFEEYHGALSRGKHEPWIFRLRTEADRDVEIRGGLAVESEAGIALEKSLAHDQGDALGLAEGFAIEIACVVELEAHSLRCILDDAVGDEGVGIVKLAIGPDRDSSAAAGAADLVNVVAFALVVVRLL